MKIAQAPKVLLLCLIAGVSWAQTPYDTAVQYAKQLLAQNRLSDAAQASIRAIKMDGSRWEAYALAGIAYAKQNSCEAAIPYFQDALTRAPEQNKGAIQESLRACTTWTDPATGLMWTKKDNGSDLTKDQAVDYCRNLRLAGYSDWRLPTIDELQGVADPQANVNGHHVKGNLRLTATEWSSTSGDASGQAWIFSFYAGLRGSVPLGFSSLTRALCVRRSGE